MSAISKFLFRDDVNSEVNYRLDGDAMIIPDDANADFPNGDTTGFTVLVDNLRISQDTGKRGNACEGSFPNAMAIIRLDRLP